MPWWEERNIDQRSCDFYGITDDPTVRDTYIPNDNTGTIILRLFIHSFADGKVKDTGPLTRNGSVELVKKDLFCKISLL